MDKQATIASLFCARVRQPSEAPALLTYQGDSLTPVTWQALAADVAAWGVALQRLGIVAGDRVAQVSENRYEWVVLDLALLVLGAVHVPVHATLSGHQIAYQANEQRIKLVLLSGPAQAEKLAPHRPLAAEMFSYDPCDLASSGVPVRPWNEMLGNLPSDPLSWIAPLAGARRPDEFGDTFLYTSGTTGEPKGVLLSQGNLTSNAVSTMAAFPQESGDVRLSWLPLSHIFARTCDLYTWLITPEMTLALGRGRDTVVPDCQAVRPTLLNGVPYFFEKVSRHLCSTDPPGDVQAMLGGRLRMCCSGGAALPDAVGQFFNDQGVVLVQGYGLTETSPVITVGTEFRPGSVGRPIPDVEVQFAADGEILTRGPHVMLGYWELPEATAEVLRDGWFYTGDLGSQDEDGFVYITGRKKEIIVTSGGKNIAPQLLEGLLNQHPLIEQAVVFGDARAYLTALLVPDRQALSAALTAPDSSPSAAVPPLEDPHAMQLLRDAVDQQLAELSPHEQIGRFSLLAAPLTIESGELTPTLKLRRKVIAEKYAAQVQALYETSGNSQ